MAIHPDVTVSARSDIAVANVRTLLRQYGLHRVGCVRSETSCLCGLRTLLLKTDATEAELIAGILDFGTHAEWCEFSRSGICTCGFAQFVAAR